MSRRSVPHLLCPNRRQGRTSPPRGSNQIRKGAPTAAAFAHFRSNAKRVSLNDCFALTYAEQQACILMTGDGPLRTLATKLNVEIHGVLWAAEHIADKQTCSLDKLSRATVYHVMRTPILRAWLSVPPPT
jgi:hypothetical protein